MSTDSTSGTPSQLAVIGAIIAVVGGVFAIVEIITKQPLIALFVAVIGAIGASVYFIRKRFVTETIIAWLVVIVIGLLIFVVIPRSGTVEGTIYAEETPVSNEQVSLIDAKGVGRNTKTDLNGHYVFEDVPEGNFKVKIRDNTIEGEIRFFVWRIVLNPSVKNPTFTPLPLTPTSTETPTPTHTPTYTPTFTLTPTETPTPTLTATSSVPFVEIVKPTNVLNCVNSKDEPFCNFEVNGTSGGVKSFREIQIYVFVFPLNPAGCGWYIQLSPASIESDGSWMQAPSFLGSSQYPVRTGHTLRIRAALVNADSTYNGTILNTLQPGTCLPDVNEIEGLIMLSDIIELKVQR